MLPRPERFRKATSLAEHRQQVRVNGVAPGLHTVLEHIGLETGNANAGSFGIPRRKRRRHESHALDTRHGRKSRMKPRVEGRQSIPLADVGPVERDGLAGAPYTSCRQSAELSLSSAKP